MQKLMAMSIGGEYVRHFYQVSVELCQNIWIQLSKFNFQTGLVVLTQLVQISEIFFTILDINMLCQKEQSC